MFEINVMNEFTLARKDYQHFDVIKGVHLATCVWYTKNFFLNKYEKALEKEMRINKMK